MSSDEELKPTEPTEPEQPDPETPEEEEEEDKPYTLSWDGDAILHFTDVGLLQDDMLYDYGIELTEAECRKVLAYIAKNFTQKQKAFDKLLCIVHTVFPEKFKKPVKPKPGPHYKEPQEETAPEPKPEPEPEPEPEPAPSPEEGGEGESQA